MEHPTQPLLARRRRLVRPGHPRLSGFEDAVGLDDVDSWELLPPPRPLDQTPAGRAEYAAKWRALGNAATEVDWSPADVARHGVAGLAEARASSGFEPWAYRTVAYYAALARYAGLTAEHLPRPDPTDGPPISATDAAKLWSPNEPDNYRNLAAWRSAAIARIAWGWPAPLDVWLALPLDAPRCRGRDVIVDGVRVPGAATVWQRWLTARHQADIGGATALATTETRRGGPAGIPLSRRGFQAAWATHTQACGTPVTYDRYRLAAVMHGAPSLGRGTIRAARRQPITH